ncbi:hypothetical protein B0H14DRAFT_3132323 [Mycena olivaceomarginata]|nr:hypothetical protein B0H14DRAFT_3132323 [Mycena olivaceomarginata]
MQESHSVDFCFSSSPVNNFDPNDPFGTWAFPAADAFTMQSHNGAYDPFGTCFLEYGYGFSDIWTISSQLLPPTKSGEFTSAAVVGGDRRPCLAIGRLPLNRTSDSEDSGQTTPPLSARARRNDERKAFKIAGILAERRRGRGKQYQVLRDGGDLNKCSWLSGSAMKANGAEAMSKWEKQKQLK